MKARVRRYTWAAREPFPIPGAYIDNYKQQVFVPGDKLRYVADRLHDIADMIEEEQQQ
ncbi:hypothetical protein [Brachybacterium sp. AOP35-5H-19]|uniref:hypothetical protein n=1 Tax=Brachybacterium sp. AOP35-5H-19 TaxID=3457685 RepID=UPI00403332B1